MLIDGGDISAGKTVYQALEDKRIRHLDILAISHLHQDHIGGLKRALSNVTSIDLTISNSDESNLSCFRDLKNEIILLWDDLCFWDSPFSAHWKESGLLPSSLFRPIHYDAHKNTYADTIYRKHFSKNYSEIVAKGAIEYIQICEKNACDYLPSSSRNTFLKNNYESLGRNQLSRISVLSPLDNALQEEYDQIVKAFNMSPLIIEFPVLIDYVMEQAEKERMSYWEMALHIREWGPVISFRKLIETIEGELGENNWNVKELDRLRKHSQQLVDDITKKAGCDLSISLTDVKPYLSPSITADIVKFDTRYMFLTDLAKYGMSNQRMKRIMKRERKRKNNL